jgi:parvulin-like peptidyl-prolyl isomerase
MQSVSRRRPRLFLAAALAAGLLAQAAARAEIVERLVARVNGDVVTLSEFEARQIAAVQQAQVPQGRIEQYLRENNQRILDEAIADLLILQRGAEIGIRLRPEYVQEVIEGIKKENNIADDAALAAALRREGMTVDDLKRNIERSIVRRQVLQRELEAKVAVPEAEARAEYERNKEEYSRPERARLQEIVLGAQDAERAREIVARARGGEDFAALARAHSTAPSRAAGGDLGWLARGELTPALEAVVFALPPGGVSEPVAYEGGVRILRVAEKEAGHVVPFEEAKAAITQRLTQQRYEGVYEAYVANLRKGAIVHTMVREVPLMVDVPKEGSILDSARPSAPGAPAAGAAAGDDEFAITPQARPERVAPPELPAASPAPAPSPTPPPPSRP